MGRHSMIIRNMGIWVLVLALVFPKMGIKVGGLPVGLASLIYMSAPLVYFVVMQRNTKLVILFALLSVSVAVNIAFYYDRMDFGYLGYLLPVLTISFYFFLKDSLNATEIKFMVRCLAGVTGVLVVYGICQKLFGEYVIMIPGLTFNLTDYAEGVGFESKSNYIAELRYLKLSSTYQNGNLFGACLLLLAPFLINVFSRPFYRLCALTLLGGVVILTASASVYFGYLLLILMSAPNRLHISLYISLCVLVTVAAVYAASHVPLIADLIEIRVQSRDLAELGGRSAKVQAYLREAELYNYVELFWGAVRFVGSESEEVFEILLISCVQVFGMFVTMMICYIFYGILKDIRGSKFSSGVYAYLGMSFVDAAFWLTPTSLLLFTVCAVIACEKKFDFGNLS